MGTVKTRGRGGARPGAGRKAIDDKKEALFIWVPASAVKKLGKDKAKAIGEGAVRRAANALK